MGTALIALSWTVFADLGMALWASIVLTIVGAFVILFAILFTIYFWNIDMKALSHLQGLLNKIYDKRKRNKKI